MVQDPVDELLKDLDDELAGHPSAAMLARVRGGVAARASHPSWLRWAGPVALTGLALLAVVVWKSRPDSATDHAVEMPVTTVASAPPSMPVIPAVQPVRAADVPSVHPALAVRSVDDARDEVIVSPDVRLGLEQLSREIASGRVTAASLEAQPWTFEPVVITPTIIEPQVVTIATGETEGGGAADGDKNPLSSPPSRMGSVL